jgi:hypothetical protein
VTNLPEAIATHLDTEGLGVYRNSGLPYTDGEFAIVLEAMPESPNHVIVVSQYEGLQVESGLPWDEPRVQIRVRGDRDPSISRDKAQAIFDELNGLGPQTVSTVRLQLIIGLGSGPSVLGLDKNQRFEHVVNFEVTMFNPNRRDVSGY